MSAKPHGRPGEVAKTVDDVLSAIELQPSNASANCRPKRRQSRIRRAPGDFRTYQEAAKNYLAKHRPERQKNYERLSAQEPIYEFEK